MPNALMYPNVVNMTQKQPTTTSHPSNPPSGKEGGRGALDFSVSFSTTSFVSILLDSTRLRRAFQRIRICLEDRSHECEFGYPRSMRTNALFYMFGNVLKTRRDKLRAQLVLNHRFGLLMAEWPRRSCLRYSSPEHRPHYSSGLAVL